MATRHKLTTEQLAKLQAAALAWSKANRHVQAIVSTKRRRKAAPGLLFDHSTGSKHTKKKPLK